jgi:neutral ceramidase
MLAGFGESRRAEGTLAPLRAQVLALRDRRGQRALLFTADVLHFGRITVDFLRARIARAHGIPASAVCFAASHTHCGPATNFRFNFAAGGLNPWYITRLEETLLKLAERALADVAPAEVSYGACEAQIGLCRRRPKEDAKAGWTIGWGPHPEGSYDTHTPILRIKRAGSPSQIVLVGHACHPTSSGVLNKWWPDYPGPMRRRLESALPDARALFAMGCGGDAKVVVRDQATGRYAFADRPEQCEAAGIKLADEVLAHLQKGKMIPLDGELQTRLVSGTLTFQPPLRRAEIEDLAIHGNPRSSGTWWARQSLAYPDTRRVLPYEIQEWRLGELTVIALEGEVCADWGAMARALPATRYAMTIGYANEVAAYIPTARIIREGGYEGFSSHRAYFLPAPFEPNMEVELSTLLERAVGHLDSGSGPGGPHQANRFQVLSQPATDAEAFERRQAGVQARAEWDGRRRQILANVQRLLGPLPGPAFRVPLDWKVVKEEKRDGYTQKTISYQVDPYDRVESYLLVPDAVHGKAPAVLALHGTHSLGKAWPAGEGRPRTMLRTARSSLNAGLSSWSPTTGRWDTMARSTMIRTNEAMRAAR